MSLNEFRDLAWMSHAAYNSFSDLARGNPDLFQAQLNLPALADRNDSNASATFALRQAQAFAGTEPAAENK